MPAKVLRAICIYKVNTNLDWWRLTEEPPDNTNSWNLWNHNMIRYKYALTLLYEDAVQSIRYIYIKNWQTEMLVWLTNRRNKIIDLNDRIDMHQRIPDRITEIDVNVRIN